MSGAPTSDKVQLLRIAIREFRRHTVTLAEIKTEIEDRKVKIPDLEETISKSRRRALDLLREMDCASTGNHGWEDRFLHLLMQVDGSPTQ